MHTYLQMLFSNYTLLPVVLLYFAKSIIPIQHAIKVQLGLERSLFWSKTQCVLSDGYYGVWGYLLCWAQCMMIFAWV